MTSADNISKIDLKSEPFANADYHVVGRDSLVMHMHSHAGFELIQTWSNDGFVLVGNKIYPMKCGALYIINGAESHCTNPLQPENYERSKIAFSQDIVIHFLSQLGQTTLLDFFFSGFQLSNHFFTFPDETALKIDEIFQEMKREFSMKETGYTAVILGCIIKILTYVQRFNSYNYPKRQDSLGHILRMTQYIEKHLLDFSLEQMCSFLHLSKYYTCHLFKRVTGLTILEYVTEQKLSAAKNMLLFTDMSISSIANECGFSSFSLFSQSFKKHIRVSPSAFRRGLLPAIPTSSTTT
jgi:AraC-like DNA-binding protein